MDVIESPLARDVSATGAVSTVLRARRGPVKPRGSLQSGSDGRHACGVER